MTNAIAIEKNGNLTTQPDFTAQQIDLIRHAIVPGANELEFDLFLNLCKAKRLDPLTRQIYGIKTGKGLQMFASIDGLRVIAQRSGQYAGQVGPFWCGEDGQWRDVWLSKDKPAAARIGVLRYGWTEPMWGVATLKSYGKSSPTWDAMPDVMLAKVAESMALRKAFPDDLSGLYERSEFRDVAEDADADASAVRVSKLSARQQDAPTRQESTHSPTPVTAEVVDAETGEIVMTAKEMGEEIKRLREVIGWSADDVREEARRNNLDLRTKDGLLGMIATLDGWVSKYESEVDVDEDDEPAQGTLIDAEMAPIDRWG